MAKRIVVLGYGMASRGDLLRYRLHIVSRWLRRLVGEQGEGDDRG